MTKAKFAERRYVPKVTLPKVALGRPWAGRRTRLCSGNGYVLEVRSASERGRLLSSRGPSRAARGRVIGSAYKAAPVKQAALQATAAPPTTADRRFSTQIPLWLLCVSSIVPHASRKLCLRSLHSLTRGETAARPPRLCSPSYPRRRRRLCQHGRQAERRRRRPRR